MTGQGQGKSDFALVNGNGLLPFAVICAVLISLSLSPALASQSRDIISNMEDTTATGDIPPGLESLQYIEKRNEFVGENQGLPIDIRRDAIREAALSYGARGGLARRTFEIRQELKKRASYMDKVFDFRQLLIKAPSGLLIEPPVIAESLDALMIKDEGQTAAVAEKIYNISDKAKIVPTPRTWRQYLEREWGEVKPPPDILRPENEEERELWIRLVREGWEEGIDQANAIFQEDLNRLKADFNGMIRYRILLSQNMVSPPFALETDRGVTGGGNEMRVGDRAVQITGPSKLVPGYDEWQPVNR